MHTICVCHRNCKAGVAVLCVLLIAGLVYYSFFPASEGGDRAGIEDVAPQTVYLVTFDTTRADHLSLYGYPRNTTPFLNFLARRGVVFDRAISPSSHTGTVHASVFTSLWPFQHGYLNHKQRRTLRLTEVTNIASFLKSEGYRPLASLSSNYPFAQVFDNLFDEVKHKDNSNPLLSPGRGALRGNFVVDSALSLLEKRPASDKVFIWLHFFDAHLPLRKYSALDGNGLDARSRSVLEAVARTQGIVSTEKAEVATVVHAIDRYDRAIRFIDGQLAHFFKKASKIRKGTPDLIIVLSDHGEGLGAHGYYEHSDAIYNEQVRSALLLSSTDETMIRPGRVSQPVSLTDLFITICDVLHSKEACAARGVQGISLKPALLNRSIEGADPERQIFSQRRRYLIGRSKPPKAGPEPWPPYELLSLQNSDYKLLKRLDVPAALFDLRKDPYETTDIAPLHPDLTQQWESDLDHFLTVHGYQPVERAIVE